MSYAIGLVIYGAAIDTKSDFARVIEAHYGEERWAALEEAGFESLYANDSVIWFGITLGEVDETETVVISELPPITPDAERLWNEKFNALPEPIRKAMPSPRHLIVWCRS